MHARNHALNPSAGAGSEQSGHQGMDEAAEGANRQTAGKGAGGYQVL